LVIADAVKVIDAEGLVVAPGFIDIKTHSDFVLPINPKAETKVRQGRRLNAAISREHDILFIVSWYFP
jgi:dihydroorotase-like cyclic amidohydrolase